MAKLKDKIQNVLDESRMMVLGAQVLVGFQFRATMEKAFETLPFSSQFLKLCALGLMLISVALLIAPTAYHRIVERGEDTEGLHRYASRVMELALLPFALGLGIDLYLAANKILGGKWGVLAGLAGLVTALFFWYVLEYVRRREREPEIKEAREMGEQEEGEQDKKTKLSDKIRHVLTEARVVLPGVQTLLGFQFIAVLMEGFEKLPDTSKYIHLVSLGLIALAIVLLMTPAAYHRIVEQGEETEHFHRFASRMVIAALVPLALGLCGDVFVVVRKVLDSTLVAAVSALFVLALFWELWFGLTIYRRTQRESAR